MPVFAGVEFLIKYEGGFVALGLQLLIERVDFIVRVAIDNADKGAASGEVRR